ncbi:MAG: hypothetical protein ACK526_15225 [Planctomyces sp.]
MKVSISNDKLEVEFRAEANDWLSFADLLCSGGGTLDLIDTTPTFGYFATLKSIEFCDGIGLITVQVAKDKLCIAGSEVARSVLAANARDMAANAPGNAGEHIHVDGLILPTAVSESAMSMVWICE